MAGETSGLNRRCGEAMAATGITIAATSTRLASVARTGDRPRALTIAPTDVHVSRNQVARHLVPQRHEGSQWSIGAPIGARNGTGVRNVWDRRCTLAAAGIQ